MSHNFAVVKQKQDNIFCCACYCGIINFFEDIVKNNWRAAIMNMVYLLPQYWTQYAENVQHYTKFDLQALIGPG